MIAYNALKWGDDVSKVSAHELEALSARALYAILRRMKQNAAQNGGRVFAQVRPTFAAVLPAVVGYLMIFVAAGVFALTQKDKPVVVGLMAIPIVFSLVCALAELAKGAIAAACNVYTFSTESVKARTGFLSTRTVEVKVSDIRGVAVNRSLMGRLLGYSSAEIGTAATAGAEIHVRDVRNLDAIIERLEAVRRSS